jgi:ABC-type transport system involved in cytochrome c biogenesis permease subunit
MRTTIPLIITFVVGMIMLGEAFIPHWRYHVITENIFEWGVILASAAFVLGLINLVQVNLPKVLNREPEWGYKALMLIALLATLAVGFYDGVDRLEDGKSYRWVFDYVFVPLNATMFALLAFYIASAAFRAFRARNVEATVLLVAAVIVMIGRVPAGEAISERFPQIVNWLMEVPNTAARRAIFIGAALGAVATGLRIILGIERSHLGGGE